jgi:hypothetical protein
MKKLSLKPDDLCVETFGTLDAARGRGTVRGAAETLIESCTCPETYDTCPETSIDCPDTYNPSCPRTCGIVIGYAPGDGEVMAPQSWNCPCM